MELPEDVLAIIRAYSKPSFKYYTQYKNIMKQLHLDDWITLRKKLNDEKKSANILLLVIFYQDSVELYHDAKEDAKEEEKRIWESGYMDFNLRIMRQERIRLQQITQSKRFIMMSRLELLTIMLYGTEKVPEQMQHPTKENTWI